MNTDHSAIISNAQACVQHKLRALSVFILLQLSLSWHRAHPLHCSVSPRPFLRVISRDWSVHSPSLIGGSTNIYLFAFQMKGSLFNTISDLVNIVRWRAG